MEHIRRWILRGRKRRYFVFRRSIYLDVVTKRDTFSLGACSQIGSPLEKGQLFQGRSGTLYLTDRESPRMLTPEATQRLNSSWAARA
jgi:predicted transcriptional regulator